jgi:hypothetical protein
MNLVKEQNLFLTDIAKLITFVQASGWLITAGESWRPDEMQKIYEAQGKAPKGCRNTHGERLAEDFNFFKVIGGKSVWITDKKSLQFIGDFWCSLSAVNKWGGNFRDKNGNPFEDTPHFERRAV